MCLGRIVQCLSLPAAGTARVRDGGAERVVSLLMLERTVGPGDWLVVHSGYALDLITAEEAATALTLRTTGLQEETS